MTYNLDDLMTTEAFHRSSLPLRPGLLVHAAIPKPLHGRNPRTIEGPVWWEAQRQEAYFRAGYRCEACGVEKELALFHAWLEAHEVYSLDYKKAELTFVEVVALCHSCHNFIHAGRMKALVEQGKMARGKRLFILEHGRGVLAAANLTPARDSPNSVPWESWRLIYNGIPYKSLFPTYESWRAHHDL